MKINNGKSIYNFIKTNLFMFVFLISAFAALIVSAVTIVNMNGTVNNMKSAKEKLDTAEALLIENYKFRLRASAEAAQNLITAQDLDVLRINPNSPDTHEEWHADGGFLSLRNRLIDFSETHGLKYVYCYFRIDNYVLPLIDNDPVLSQSYTPADDPIPIDDEARSSWNNKIITVTTVQVYTDDEELMTAYAPILDEYGDVVALIGVDIRGEQLLTLREEIISLGNHAENLSSRISYLIMGMVFTLILILTGGVLTFAANRKRAAALSNALLQEEAANRAKSGFLSTMSHEIRTPMNAIIGITEIQLQNEKLESNVQEGLNKIYNSGHMLLGIINDILDLSKIEAGKLELVIADYEVASLISDTAQLNIVRIGSKAIEFEVYVDESLPQLLSGDELRVKQVLNNILSNAFKYTKEGTVKLSVSTEEADNTEDSVMMVFTVSDTGQGMSKEQVDKLFDEYSRFNMEANRTTEGTGLGMSITEKLIKLMNGKIFVESEPEKGTVFTVWFPQKRLNDNILGKEMANNLHNFRNFQIDSGGHKREKIIREPMPYGSVLIVDDVETNIYVARGLMNPYGLTIDSADNGFAALDKVNEGNVYDIIFMDHMMPKMDGIETTEKIRNMGYKGTIVALSANAVAGQAEIFLSSGLNDFISKPINIRQLNNILNKYIRDKQPPEILEEARKQEKEATSVLSAPPKVDPRLAEIFARDARKAIATLQILSEIDDYTNEENLRTYIINVHGMKSALANIGNINLSAVARDLEMNGREKVIEKITTGTPAFLNLLRSYVEELSPQNEEAAAFITDENNEILKEKLLAVKTACEEYDENTADTILNELEEKKWTHETKEILNTISEYLIHSDFDEIIELIDKYIN